MNDSMIFVNQSTLKRVNRWLFYMTGCVGKGLIVSKLLFNFLLIEMDLR